MLTRVYIDNYRSLVNFELRLGRENLLMGANGTGKTTVFEVLFRLKQFLAGDAKAMELFPPTTLTRWQSSRSQRYEFELKVPDRVYNYALVIEHDEDRRKSRIKIESLHLNGQLLFDMQNGMAQLYHDDYTPGPKYPFGWSQSGIGMLPERPDNKKLTLFRKEMDKIIVVSVHPMNMDSESREEEKSPSRNMENFASWYRCLSQEHQGMMVTLFQELKNVIPNFSSFSLKEAGEARVLKVVFDKPGADGRPMVCDFNEISDGQRVLIVLYSLLYGLKESGVSLFLDEPDNFVALREIQPFLTSLTDFIGHGIDQTVIISHHPEIIDYLASSSGIWFVRDDNGPTRLVDKPVDLTDGLTISQNMARGWQP